LTVALGWGGTVRAKVEVGVEGFESCFEDLEILRTSNAGIIMVWAIQKATAARCGCCIPNSGAHNDMRIKYTSEMTPEQAIAEIRSLVRHGASAIMTDYNKQTGKPSAPTFEMKLGDQSLIFRLPRDWRPVYLI